MIIYFNNLKMQMSEELSNYQKYFNLMKILHFYLKIAIIKRINAIILRTELKEIARLTKKIESISNHIKKIKKSYSIENIKQHRFQFTVELIESTLTHRRMRFKIMIETMIAIERIIKNATKKIVMINSTTTRIDFK